MTDGKEGNFVLRNRQFMMSGKSLALIGSPRRELWKEKRNAYCRRAFDNAT
jgi:hypothetical protein